MHVTPARQYSQNGYTVGKPFPYTLNLLLIVSLTVSSSVFAQEHDAQMLHDPAHLEHGQPDPESTPSQKSDTVVQGKTLPVQVGQSAFAAIAEIVAILDSDPDTDWASVNIDALRAHLVDMDRIVLNAHTETLQVDDQQIRFVITGKDDTLTAIRNMVPAHASVVQSMTHWMITTTEQTDGAAISIQTSDTAAITRLKALGFHGFLTIGAHHQEHHLQMARGATH